MTTPALRAAAASADYDRWIVGTMSHAEFVAQAQKHIALMMIAAAICDPERIAELTKALREPFTP